MTVLLNSRFSVSTISSTETTTSTNGEEAATKAPPDSGRADHTQFSGPLASLREIKQKRRQGIVMNGALIQESERVKMQQAQAKIVNIPPREAGSTVPRKPLGLPSSPKAFLTDQTPQEAKMPDTKAVRQYELPTPENRANLRQRPTATPMQDTTQRVGLFSGKPRGVNKQQTSNLRAGWKAGQEILNTEE
ncbi:hypothetical protein [Paraburkholderia aspalathi]|uniref:hypothetical protein n=1 Tax=Paraburkholderia aspalathi TaxID=1324617 RepID=UPI0038BAD862